MAKAGSKPTSKNVRRRSAPVEFSEELRGEILDRLSAGERWAHIARSKQMPNLRVIYKWRDRDPEFAKALKVAKQAGADMRADAVLDVAERATKETLGVDRAHIGALKWHVDRDDRIWRREEPDLGAGRVLIVRFRDFETYVDDDGVRRVREIPLPPPGHEDGQ